MDLYAYMPLPIGKVMTPTIILVIVLRQNFIHEIKKKKIKNYIHPTLLKTTWDLEWNNCAIQLVKQGYLA